MAAEILHQVKLGNKYYWALKGRNFRNKGVSFSIVGSNISGPAVYDVVHTVKNDQTGAYADITMTKLIQILQASE